MRFIVQVRINAIALWVAAEYAPAAVAPGNVWDLLIVALVFGVLNAIVRPILNLITCPAYVLTLGLFTFVMNVFILWILQWLTDRIFFGDFWQTMVAGLIVSVVSFVLNLLLFGSDGK